MRSRIPRWQRQHAGDRGRSRHAAGGPVLHPLKARDHLAGATVRRGVHHCDNRRWLRLAELPGDGVPAETESELLSLAIYGLTTVDSVPGAARVRAIGELPPRGEPHGGRRFPQVEAFAEARSRQGFRHFQVHVGERVR